MGSATERRFKVGVAREWYGTYIKLLGVWKCNSGVLIFVVMRISPHPCELLWHKFTDGCT